MTRVLQTARDLLDQQLWCMGRDGLHPEGSALLRYGVERVRPPGDETGSSAYVLSLPGADRCVPIVLASRGPSGPAVPQTTERPDGRRPHRPAGRRWWGRAAGAGIARAQVG